MSGRIIQHRNLKRQPAYWCVEAGEDGVPAQVSAERGPDSARGIEGHTEEDSSQGDIAEAEGCDVWIGYVGEGKQYGDHDQGGASTERQREEYQRNSTEDQLFR